MLVFRIKGILDCHTACVEHWKMAPNSLFIHYWLSVTLKVTTYMTRVVASIYYSHLFILNISIQHSQVCLSISLWDIQDSVTVIDTSAPEDNCSLRSSCLGGYVEPRLDAFPKTLCVSVITCTQIFSLIWHTNTSDLIMLSLSIRVLANIKHQQSYKGSNSKRTKRLFMLRHIYSIHVSGLNAVI